MFGIFNPFEQSEEMMDKSFHPDYYMDAPVSAASVLRENNVPFEVIGTKNIAAETADVLILSHVAAIRDEEMDEIEKFLEKGTNRLQHVFVPMQQEKAMKD